jgi:hypothetical protein
MTRLRKRRSAARRFGYSEDEILEQAFAILASRGRTVGAVVGGQTSALQRTLETTARVAKRAAALNEARRVVAAR